MISDSSMKTTLRALDLLAKSGVFLILFFWKTGFYTTSNNINERLGALLIYLFYGRNSRSFTDVTLQNIEYLSIQSGSKSIKPVTISPKNY